MEPSVCLIKTTTSGSCMIISHFNSPNSYIIWFDHFSGHPLHNGIPGYDVFPSEAKAKEYISSITKIERENRAQYLIGINNIKNHYLIISVITKTKELCKIMDKHPVYLINSYANWCLTLDNDSPYDENNAEQERQYFSYFPVPDLHFFCPTFDLTSTFGSPQDPTMIWNLRLLKPFQKLKIPCCVNLIQGSFGAANLGDKTFFYSIIRRCCLSSLPLAQEQEISEDKNLGNEFEIEYVLERFKGGHYETWSHVLRRCDLPHLFSHRMLSPEEATVIYSSFFNRLIELYHIPKISFIDLSDSSTSKNHLDPNGDTFLKNVITMISGAFDVEFEKFDWNHHSQIDILKAANYLLGLLDKVVDKFGFDLMVWENGYPSVIQKQTGFCVVSDKSGFDQSIFGSFIIGLYYYSKIVNEFGIIPSVPDNYQSLSELKCTAHLFRFFIFSNRKLGQLSTIPTSFSERDFGILTNIKENNLFDKQNYQTSNNTKDIIKAFLKINSKSSIIYTEEDCVSIVPAAHVVYPSNLNLKIFSLFKNELSFIDPQEPITICLARPCNVTKIIFKIPKSNTSSYSFVKPSSVTVSGGMYLNRLFPLFEDILIVGGETIKTITISSRHQYTDKYQINANLSSIEKVRYVQFRFNSIFPRVTISNIFVYGNCEMKKKNEMSKILSENVDIDNYKHVQIPTFSEDVCPDTITSWEKKRLYSFLTFNDFALKMIERELNPFQMTVSSLIELKNYKNMSPGKIPCSVCGRKKSVYQCGMCGNFFCTSCKPQVETKEMQSESKSITVNICSDCSEIRNKILKLKPLLELLKARMVVKMYPFIGRYDQLLDRTGYQNRGTLIGTQFISEPPPGVTENSLAELVLDPSNDKVWDPKESFVPLLIYLKQESFIESISIRCNSPLKVILDNQEELEFVPPFTEHKLLFDNSFLILRVNLVAPKIQIKNISIFGAPVSFGYPVYSMMPNSLPSKVKEIQSKQTPQKDKSMIRFRIDQQESVFGLLFDEIVGDQTVFFEYVNDSNKKSIVPLNFPKGRFTSCSIEFPRPYKVKEFNLWFSSSKNQAKNMKISPLCLSKGGSSTASSIIHYLNI